MSSLHRQSGRPYWFCAYRGLDGKQHFRSTGTKDRAEANIVCAALAKGARLARKHRLTPDAARRIIETALNELLDESGQTLPLSTTRAFFLSWLKQKETDGAESSHARYKGIVDRFLEFLGPRADSGLSSLTTEDVNTFIVGLTDEVSSGTVNTYLKVLRTALGRAVKRQLIPKNPASLVDTLRGRDRHERRAFRLDELRRLFELADAEWRTMLLFGLYTGLRLQDVATLDWGNLDLQRKELTITTGKTGRTQILPLHPALLRHLLEGTAGDDPDAPLLPSLAGRGSGWLSNQFYDLMSRAKLVPARGHQKGENGKGRGRRRQLHAVSFHALRHTATSLLKNAGVSDAIARDIIGHESEAISRNYTHIDEDTKREAIHKMPDLFK